MRTTVASLLLPIGLVLTLAACGGGDECPAGSMPVGDRCVESDAGDSADAQVDASSDGSADDGGGDAGTDACVATGVETCNGVDDNCDGTIDEGVTTVFYLDADGDGFGTGLGKGTTVEACSAPSGYAAAVGDCDDSVASAHPGGTEVCNGVDDNCDGTIDEGFGTVTHYADVDGDGYGDIASVQTTCSLPIDRILMGGDCDDAVAAIHPGVAEICNMADDDCDGMTDEGVTMVFYRDADGDGYGIASMSMSACAAPTGYVGNSTDCNDGAMSAHPGAAELCNAIDDDCNVVVDNGFMCVQAAPTSCTTTCGSTGTGSCTAGCAVPSAAACTLPTESCNRFDDDCDGLIDEGSGLAWGSVSDIGRNAADQVAIVGNGVFYAALSRIGTSVVVRQLDTTMTPTGADVTVASDATAVAMTLSGTDVVVAWIGAGGDLYAKRAPLTTLAFPAGATTIAILPAGFNTAVEVAASGTNLLFAYVGGNDIHGIRTNATFGAATANTLLVPGNDLAFRRFDIAPAAAGGWAVAYSEQLTTETDREVFLQGIAASGVALDGAAFRTSDATDETFPTLAYDATGDRFVMAWLDGSTARINTFRLAGSGASRAITAERVTPSVVVTTATPPANLLATPLALDVAAGTAMLVYVASSVESSRYELATLASSGVGRVSVTYSGIDSVGVVTPVGTSGGRPTLLPARAIADRDLSTRAFVLGCP